MSNQEIYNKVISYPTKNKEGFNPKEIEDIKKQFNIVNENKFNDALTGITGLLDKGEFITYHIDVYHAILCGVENRNLKLTEFD